MNTIAINTALSTDIKVNVQGRLIKTRNRVISAADVWNIQRNKRARVQRRAAF